MRYFLSTISIHCPPKNQDTYYLSLVKQYHQLIITDMRVSLLSMRAMAQYQRNLLVRFIAESTKHLSPAHH